MINRFFDYVEIKTKITSFFAFWLGIAYVMYTANPINWQLSGIFFASMFLFDLTTTAINNYIDTKTNTQVLQFSRKIALCIIYALFAASALLGLYLAYLTDAVVLIAGGFCFLCGVLYTWGPLPISRLPFGEFFSGLFYGLIIPFILLYINLPEGYFLTLALSAEQFTLSLNVFPLFTLALLSVAPFFSTSNIMLANNICDLERDVAVKRHTIAYYLGKKALTLFAVSYYAIYAATVLLVVFKMLPWPYLLFLLTFIPVQKNIAAFYKKQQKETTFMYSIQNYVIIMTADVVLIFLCAVLKNSFEVL